MKTKYLGIKVVDAEEMTAKEALTLNYRIGKDENEDGYEVTYDDGYKSWCPKNNFLTHNRPMKEGTLATTIPGMFDINARVRLEAEISQMSIKIETLKNDLADMRSGKLELPGTPYTVLANLLSSMQLYQNYLVMTLHRKK